MALWTDPQIPELGPNVSRAHGPLAAALGRFMMGVRGWRVEGNMPDIPRMVLIVAPHTSNWDFLTGLWVKLAMRMGARFVGKHTLFRVPARRPSCDGSAGSRSTARPPPGSWARRRARCARPSA